MENPDKICSLRSMDNNTSFFVVYYRNNKKEEWNWNIMKSRKRFVSFVRGLEKRDKQFEIYSCNSKRKLPDSEVRKLLLVGKVPTKRELMLDDYN